MEAFAQKLRNMGLQDVRLIDTAQEVFGSLDAMKVLSCMTLFNEVASDDLFQQVIDHYYQGKVDETTKRKLEK